MKDLIIVYCDHVLGPLPIIYRLLTIASVKCVAYKCDK